MLKGASRGRIVSPVPSSAHQDSREGVPPSGGSPVPKSSSLHRIKAVVTDVDGTLTDGLLQFDSKGNVSKSFHARDGYGGALLIAQGISIAILTGRDDPATLSRVRALGWDVVGVGEEDKVSALASYCQEKGLLAEEVLYLGDDVNDCEAMAWAGIGCAVGNAHPLAKETADWVLEAEGGKGAFREMADALLQ